MRWSAARICAPQSQPVEKKASDARELFVDPAKEDYHLKGGSPAVDAGADPAGPYPKAAFPGYDFHKDLDGRPRKQGAAIDIGPYESGPGTGGK